MKLLKGKKLLVMGCMTALFALTTTMATWAAPEDTEVVIEAIEEEGDEGVDLIEGPAGFAPEIEYDAFADKDEEELRDEVVNYALSFVGGRYKYGGNDPHTGVDCSGFTRYIMKHAAGVDLARSSSNQAGEGVAVSSDEMQPGDLLFYGKGKGINHVAMYIGDGKIVHASTEKTGIKTSPWNYRNPVKIVSVLG